MLYIFTSHKTSIRISPRRPLPWVTYIVLYVDMKGHLWYIFTALNMSHAAASFRDNYLLLSLLISQDEILLNQHILLDVYKYM